MYNGLASRGHEIHLFTFRDPVLEKTQEPHALDALHPTILPRELKWSPLRLAQVLRTALDRIRPDIWHAHIAIPYGVAAAAVRRHPFLLTTHGSDVYLGAWLQKSIRLRDALTPVGARIVFRALHAGLAASVDRVVVYSPDMLAVLPRLGYAPGKLVPCYLGIDTERFRPAIRSSASEDAIQLVCTRHLEPIYDHPTLLEAVARLRAEGLRVRLVLAGAGTSRSSLEDLSRRLGIAEAVEFLGAVPQARLPALLASSDVLVSASRSDTTAMSVLEGMACGLPVVATAVGSLPMRVEDGVSGFLFPPGDVTRLTTHLRRLATDTDLRKRMGKANGERASREFDLRTTVVQLEEAYFEAGRLDHSAH